MPRIDELKKNIEARNLSPENIFIASFIAGISSFGILNQAVIAMAARQIGKDLAEYYSVTKSETPDSKAAVIDNCRSSIEMLQSLIHISDEITCNDDNDIILMKIQASTCRYCPKGVGHAELSGTLCPFPTLIEKFINTLNDKELIKVLKERAVPLLKKVDDWCLIRYIESD